jgi:hypothetical protein
VNGILPKAANGGRWSPTLVLVAAWGFLITLGFWLLTAFGGADLAGASVVLVALVMGVASTLLGAVFGYRGEWPFIFSLGALGVGLFVLSSTILQAVNGGGSKIGSGSLGGIEVCFIVGLFVAGFPLLFGALLGLAIFRLLGKNA